jgi:ketosteroid isomerase-like protein
LAIFPADLVLTSVSLVENQKSKPGVEEKKLGERFITALRSRDWNLLRSLLTEDVVWNLPGESIISGEARGTEAVVERSQTIVSYDVNFTLKHILIGRHDMALSLHNTASRGDAVLDEHLATVFTLRDGKIAAINTNLSDVDMVNEFFIPVNDHTTKTQYS